MERTVVSVLKKDKIVNIPEAELSKDDILLLQAGDLVPADVKLIESRGLQVDEFDLTGEIMPVEKQLDEKEDVFVFKGSRVTRGNGKGLVIAIGEATEYGKILNQKWGQVKYRFPPIIRGKYFVLLALLLPPLVISLIYYDDLAIVSFIFFIVSLFVLLIQNGDLFKYLSLSREVKKLASKGIELHDETSLGSICEADVLCFDKTGVLTTRDIKVKNIHFVDESPNIEAFVSNEGIFGLTKTACALCNDVIYLEKIEQANPIDKALISFAQKYGVDFNQLVANYRRIYEKPFDSEDRYMEVGFVIDDRNFYFVKGAPEVIQKMCKGYNTVHGVKKNLDFTFLSSVKTKSSAIDETGDRTIALAYGTSSQNTPPQEYTFLCIIQLENPLKQEAPSVVKALKEMGVRSVIMTGDKPETALKIGKDTGIDNSNYSLTGKTMERMDFQEIARQSDYISVYSRLLPSQKGTLVRLLQQRNHFVVMVGDGSNDVIALRVADVGVSFKMNSSPFAKRVSKILVNNLSNLLSIIQSACRVKNRIRYLMFARTMFLVLIYLILYLRTLNLAFHI